MGKQRSFSQYRSIDLVIFALILVVFESIVVKAALAFASQAYSVSLVSAVTCIVFMRWGFYGCFHAVLGGFVYCYATGGTVTHFVIYMIGNLLSAFAVLYVNKIGSVRIRDSFWLSMLMAVLVTLLMQLGRGIVAVLLGLSPALIPGFIVTDTLSGVFAMVIVGIARKLDGVFEDQKHYLLRINEKDQEIEEGFDEG